MTSQEPIISPLPVLLSVGTEKATSSNAKMYYRYVNPRLTTNVKANITGKPSDVPNIPQISTCVSNIPGDTSENRITEIPTGLANLPDVTLTTGGPNILGITTEGSHNPRVSTSKTKIPGSSNSQEDTPRYLSILQKPGNG